MKLFTKEIDKKLFAQYHLGNNLEEQYVVAKIFNPYGNGRWYLLNSDPNDADYLWAIVQMGNVVEVGSVSRHDLENARVSKFRLPLERDLSFKQEKADVVLKGLMQGKFFKHGGSIHKDDKVVYEEVEFEEYKHGGMMAKGGEVKFDYELKVQPDFKYKNIANRWLEDNSKDSLKYKLAILILREKHNPDEILGIKDDNQYARLLRSLEKAKGSSDHEMEWRTENYSLAEAEKWTKDSLREMFYVHGEKMADGGMMAKGGETHFKDKVKAIEKRLKGTKVKPKYQSKYGKKYNKEEAHEAASNIAGAIVKKYKMK